MDPLNAASGFQAFSLTESGNGDVNIACGVAAATPEEKSLPEPALSYHKWRDLYNRTATVVTPRLELTHPGFTDEECSLVKQLNEEYVSGVSRWTVLEVEKGTPNNIIKNLLKLTVDSGCYFSRLWFLKEKHNNQLIGLLQSSRLDKQGLSEIDRHIAAPFCRKGYGSEALNEVFSFYRSMPQKTIIFPTLSEYKLRIIPSLKVISEFYLEKEDAEHLLKEVEDVSENDPHFASKYVSRFPANIRAMVEVALKPLGKHNRPAITEYKGLRAYASTQAALISLKKCDFTKQGEDKWVKYCK